MRCVSSVVGRMLTKSIAVLGIAAVVLVGAGSASADSHDGLGPNAQVPAWAGKRVHFFPGKLAALHALGRECTPNYCPTPPLLYYGGAGVQRHPVVYLIFWGSNWNGSGASLKQQLINLYTGFQGNSWQGVMGQYYDNLGYADESLNIGPVFTDTRVAAPSSVDDSAIQQEADYAAGTQGWPTNDLQAQLIVFTAPGSSYAPGFGTGSNAFCGYHGILPSGGPYTFVPYIGDQPFYNECVGYDSSGNANNVTSMVASHEYAESATDPDPNSRTWQTSDGYEIADICSSGDNQLPNGSWVQGLWDNAQNACSLSDTTAYFPYKHDAPAVTVGSTGTASLATETLSGTLYSIFGSGSSWNTHADTAPQSAYSAPSEAVDKTGNTWIAVRGPNNSVTLEEHTAAGGWATWGYVNNGSSFSAPSIAVDPQGNQWIAVQGPSNSLTVIEHTTSNTWPSWGYVGNGTTVAAPSIATDATGNVWIAVEAPNGNMTLIEHTVSSTWASWPYLNGGSTYSAPSIATDSLGNQWMAVQGPNNSLTVMEHTNENKWASWGYVGNGTTVAAPSIATDAAGNVWIAVEAPNSNMTLIEHTVSGTWASWPYLNRGSTYSSPSIATDSLGNQWMAGQGASDSVTLLEHTTSNTWASWGYLTGSDTTN